MKYFKYIFSVFSGILIAAIIILPLEQIIYKFFPTPTNIDLNNLDEINKHISELPYYAFTLEAMCYAIGAFMGGVVATLSSDRKQIYPALIVGLALAIGGLFNPGPMLFNVLSIFVYIPFSLLGFLVSKIKKQKDFY